MTNRTTYHCEEMPDGKIVCTPVTGEFIARRSAAAGSPDDLQTNTDAGWGRPDANCSLARWPHTDEVRAHYLTPEIGCAYALVTGFSDYGPVVAKFYITCGLVDDDEVFVDFPVAPSLIPVEMLKQQAGFTVEFLCLANATGIAAGADGPHMPGERTD